MYPRLKVLALVVARVEVPSTDKRPLRKELLVTVKTDAVVDASVVVPKTVTAPACVVVAPK